MHSKEPNLSAIITRTVQTMQSREFVHLMARVALLCVIGFLLWLAGAVFSAHYFISQMKLAPEEDFLMNLIAGWLAGGVASMLAWLFLPVIVPLVATFFQDSIAGSIERSYYPEYPLPSNPTHWATDLWTDIKFVGLILIVNILLLPLYLIPLANVLLYYALNGYLLSREFFENAAKRHIPRAEAVALRQKHYWMVWGIGIMVVAMTNVPILNVLSPFFAVAMMVHLFHAAMPRPPQSEALL